MRIVSTELIEKAVEELFKDANYILPDSLAKCIKDCEKTEENILAKSVLAKLSENLDAAKQINVPVCQDTGMAVLFAEIGNEVHRKSASIISLCMG